MRDIYSIGLKTLIQDVPDEMGVIVSDKLASRLLNGIARDSAGEDTRRECLDNMGDLLRLSFDTSFVCLFSSLLLRWLLSLLGS